MSKLKVEELLFNDQPITINRKLAKYLGVTEAIVFQQIHYWLRINEKTKNNFKENKYWVYNSITQWKENEFEFLSESTIKRTLQKLEKLGLLEVGVFNKMRGDKTKWYTINYDKLLEVCEVTEIEKKKLSDKRKAASMLAVKARKNKNTIEPNWSNGGASDQFEPMIEPNWSNDGINLVEPIPKTTTKTTTEITTSSCSSKEQMDLANMFKDNICELKKITSTKFINNCDTLNHDLIVSIIEYAAEINIKSYAGFETIVKEVLKNNISTSEEFLYSIEKYRSSKKKRARSSSKKSSKGNFNSYEQRTYDFEELEKKLLGWN